MLLSRNLGFSFKVNQIRNSWLMCISSSPNSLKYSNVNRTTILWNSSLTNVDLLRMAHSIVTRVSIILTSRKVIITVVKGAMRTTASSVVIIWWKISPNFFVSKITNFSTEKQQLNVQAFWEFQSQGQTCTATVAKESSNQIKDTGSATISTATMTFATSVPWVLRWISSAKMDTPWTKETNTYQDVTEMERCIKANHCSATIAEWVSNLRTSTSPVANVITTTAKSAVIKEFDETKY